MHHDQMANVTSLQETEWFVPMFWMQNTAVALSSIGLTCFFKYFFLIWSGGISVWTKQSKQIIYVEGLFHLESLPPWSPPFTLTTPTNKAGIWCDNYVRATATNITVSLVYMVYPPSHFIPTVLWQCHLLVKITSIFCKCSSLVTFKVSVI